MTRAYNFSDSVHRFSNGTMPFMNVFKKWAFSILCISGYWFDCGCNLVLAIIIYWVDCCSRVTYIVRNIRPLRLLYWIPTGTTKISYISLLDYGLWVSDVILSTCNWLFQQFAELSNFHTHMTLRGLRPPGTRTRAIPYGYGFSLVSCPNYFFEVMGWVVIAVMTNSIAGKFFLHLTIRRY